MKYSYLSVFLQKLILLSGVLATLMFTVAAQAGGDKCDTALHDHMHDVKDEMRALVKAVKSSAEDAVINERVDNIVALLEKSKLETPLALTKLKDADEKAKQQKKFVKGMEHTIELVKKVKTANDRGAALKDIKKAIKKGHRAFKDEDCDD